MSQTFLSFQKGFIYKFDIDKASYEESNMSR